MAVAITITSTETVVLTVTVVRRLVRLVTVAVSVFGLTVFIDVSVAIGVLIVGSSLAVAGVAMAMVTVMRVGSSSGFFVVINRRGRVLFRLQMMSQCWFRSWRRWQRCGGFGAWERLDDWKFGERSVRLIWLVRFVMRERFVMVRLTRLN